ncbi:hypothetical protein Y032_0629g844 [Ancylostoma ceylanicum]|uniref:Uncharacterized protein n=1 Tax=Ancylostoma ceylanicum TaxID=53326 RepID=A0A016WKJ2_9BILA|nr:hypothetical protein Y032_0629g844 [Ancylostoma ceylanicum]
MLMLNFATIPQDICFMISIIQKRTAVRIIRLDSMSTFRYRVKRVVEGALLQLRNDIHGATRKIPKDSWYYAAVSEEDTPDERMDWMERLNEAITLFTTRVSKSEELELREKRALPKLVVRAVMQKVPTHNESASTSAAVCESTAPNDDAKPEVSDTEEQHNEEAPAASFEEDITDFAYPEDDASAGVEEEMMTAVGIPTEETVDQSNEPECETTIRKNKTVVDDKEEPPKKREKRIKSEVDVKVEETEQEYFTKSGQHNVVPLRDRFKIVDPRTLVRSEDVIFMRRKPLARRVITEYKFENFIKPGLLHKGRYPRMYLELKNQKHEVESIFNGILKQCCEVAKTVRDDTNNADAESDVYDEWLATFGGFRIFYEEGTFGLDENEEAHEPLSQDLGFSDNENTSMHMDNSNHCAFNDSANSFLSSGNTTRRDRFHDIRPDEYKAIGIDVKNIVPNKDFYSMTKEERAAAVAAEFEAIDALGPKKEDGYVISIMDFSCRVSSYHLNTARMKRVMKSILSNPLLAYDKVLYTRRALLRRRAVERSKTKDIDSLDPNEVYYKKLDRSLDASLGPLAEKILEERNPMDITALDPIDVLEAVTYRNLEGMIDAEELSNNCTDSTSKGVEESMRQFAAEVRQADFKVQGLHTFSSVMQCLPRRMGNSGKYVNIANALAVTLYMCNENTLTLVQERTDTVDKNESVNEGEPWMGNFIITNANDAALFQGNVLDAQELSSPVDRKSYSKYFMSIPPPSLPQPLLSFRNFFSTMISDFDLLELK